MARRSQPAFGGAELLGEHAPFPTRDDRLGHSPSNARRQTVLRHPISAITRGAGARQARQRSTRCLRNGPEGSCACNPSLHSASDGPHIVAAALLQCVAPRRFTCQRADSSRRRSVLTQEEVRPGVAEDRATIRRRAILMRRCGRLSLCVSRSVRRRRAGGVRALDWCLGAVREEWLDTALAVWCC